MSSSNSRLESPLHRRPPPVITAAPAEVNSLVLEPGSALSPAFPVTPTPTLGGHAVRQSDSAGGAIVTFTDSSSLSLASPLGVPSDATRPTATALVTRSTRSIAPPRPQSGQRLRHDEDFDNLSHELYAMVGHFPDADLWRKVIDEALSLDHMSSYFIKLPTPPHTVDSAEAIFEYHLREQFHHLIPSNSSTNSSTSPNAVLTYLVKRARGILCRAWDEVVEPYLQSPPIIDNHPRGPRVSLTIPSPNLGFGGFSSYSELSHTTTSAPAAAAASAPEPPSGLVSVSDGLRGEVSTAAVPIIQANDFDSPEADAIRVSLDSIETTVAVINEELHEIAVSGKTKEAAPRVGYLKRARKQLLVAGRVLAFSFGVGSSRSPSPSPSPSPTIACRGEGPFGEHGQVEAERQNPLDDAIPPSRTPSNVSSLPPWFVAPHTRAPQGARAMISPSASSGKFRMGAIVHLQPPTTPPIDSTPSGRPATANRPPSPSIVLPPYATSPQSDIVRLILLSGTEAEIADPTQWLVLFDRVVGVCEFASSSDALDNNSPSTSTRTAQSSITCVNQHHHNLDLPCVSPIAIPFGIDISSLLRQLAVSQQTRANQLMIIVAQASFNPSAPGPSSSNVGATGASSGQGNTGGVGVKGKSQFRGL